MTELVTGATWTVSPMPQSQATCGWQGGWFETAARRYTRAVEGNIRSDCHLIMATTKGGAIRHEFRTDSGLRYSGRDRVGTVSFLPAGCERRLSLEHVAWEWGAIAVHPGSVAADIMSIAPFIEPSDPFLYGLIAQMKNLLSVDGALDATYCSVMTIALAEYLLRRSGRPVRAKGIRQLSARQLRMTMERIDHLLPQPVQIADLATPLGISEGHFYRAFRGAAGRTPVQAISERRVERAASLLAQTDCSVNRIALEVGLASPSHLARLFRTILGTTPSEYRREFRAVAVPARNDQDEAIRSG
ncbi:helix-turn-helix domain-containing protein [Mesorhizobium wenxiniae]|nr:AraC family transcriptional regulator [Mesorhizobium wenxiniae]